MSPDTTPPIPPGPSSAPTVLLIAGAGRSGSTILSQLLGCIDGFVSVGEVRWLFDAGLVRNQLCSCGTPLRDCGFWGAVMARGFPDVSLDDLVALKHRVDRRRDLMRLARPALRSPRYRSDLAAYARVYSRLFGAIRGVSGAPVIVDASKHPCYAFLLREVPDIDLKVVHLVRDSRAVAYSCLRRKRKHSVTWREEYMPVDPPALRAVKWAGTNAFCDRLRDLGDRYMRLRYEDFADDPAGALAAIAAHAGRPGSSLKFLDDEDGVDLSGGHVALGNPGRFTPGPVRLKADREWERGLAARHRLVVGALTFPWLRRYGYR